MSTPGTRDGTGYLADGGGPPVLVHAWWGLVPTVTDVWAASPPRPSPHTPRPVRRSHRDNDRGSGTAQRRAGGGGDEGAGRVRRPRAEITGHRVRCRVPGARHWFAEPDRQEYEPAATDQAWARTIEFLQPSG